jgi:hypothetical protein
MSLAGKFNEVFNAYAESMILSKGVVVALRSMSARSLRASTASILGLWPCVF